MKDMKIFLWILLFTITACGVCPVACGAAVTGPQVALTQPVPLVTAPLYMNCSAPCECMPESQAIRSWGQDGFTRCGNLACGSVPTIAGPATSKYCYQKKALTVSPVTRRTVLPVNITTTIPPLSIQPTILPVTRRTIACPANRTLCNLTCVYTGSDKGNCGSCGHQCGPAETCENGKCIIPAVEKADPCLIQGKVTCGGTCIDIHGSDSDNCGGCGWTCPAGLSCYQGECSMECPAGQIDCQYNCYDPMTDPEHCGSCGNACGQGESCCAGKCTSTATDSANCGSCGKACDVGKSQACSNGFCQCKPGTLLCNQQQGCIDVNYNWQHCGSCDNVCTSPEICVMGHCGFEPACGTKNSQTGTFETCADGIQNQDESGVDCGGKCAPCNTKCTTGTRYAPADTPCTSVYNYQPTVAGVPASNYPDDNYWVDAHYTACPFCYYPCRSYEVCHPALDPMIAEAAKCCSLTKMSDVDALMPEPEICKYAIKMAPWSCQKCTGIYLIKELADGTRWMDGYQDETETAKAKAIQQAGGSPPYGTTNYLINYYHTGICHDYANAVTTLLRKDGYAQADVGSYCDGAHCYNVVRFPGDTRWNVVDTDMPNEGGDTWQLGKLQAGYAYCHTMNESEIFYNMGSYFTGPIPDVGAYWNTVNNGQPYQYQQKTPFTPKCENAGTPSPCSMQYGGPPLTGPGVGGIGKDNWRLPDVGVRKDQLVGC